MKSHILRPYSKDSVNRECSLNKTRIEKKKFMSLIYCKNSNSPNLPLILDSFLKAQLLNV